MQAEALRVREGANPATPPARLAGLARDPSVTVRASLAMNPAAPPDAVAALARDADERVRAVLAQRLATLVPTLPPGSQDRLRAQVWDTLTLLALDAAEKVRAVVAEEIKALPDAPHATVLCLAQDPAAAVHEPVIRFSPMLTTEDLIALLARPASRVAVGRRAALPEPVCDALVATGDAVAIQALLENPSARIREATLDALVDESAGHPDWHAPLVDRPALSAGALRALAAIVAEELLDRLLRRAALPADVAAHLRRQVNQRLGSTPAPADPAMEVPTAPAFVEAIRVGDPVRLATMLAVAAGVPATIVQRAVRLRSAKGLVSLAWRAALPMPVAIGLQTVLGGIPALDMIVGQDGEYPLTPAEMTWQLDFLAGSATAGPTPEVHVWGAG